MVDVGFEHSSHFFAEGLEEALRPHCKDAAEMLCSVRTSALRNGIMPQSVGRILSAVMTLGNTDKVEKVSRRLLPTLLLQDYP